MVPTMNISPSIAYPGSGPVRPQAPEFRSHVVRAFDLTGSALSNLATLKSGVTPILDPIVGATVAARLAINELKASASLSAPADARAGAAAAQRALEIGVGVLTHRLNGPLPLDAVIDQFTTAQEQMQTSLDVLGAADMRIQLPSPDSPVQ